MRFYKKANLVFFILTFTLLFMYFFKNESTTIKVERAIREKQFKKILIVFSIPPIPCPYQHFNRFLHESYINRLQYANIKDYDVFFNNRQPDPRLRWKYNKVAILSEILRNQTFSNATTQYEWILWLDSDAIVLNMSFEIPFKKYVNHNLVLLGNEKRLRKVGDVNSINTGVLLLRNNEWSRKLLEVVSSFGYDEKTARIEELKRGIANFNSAYFDQNGFVYILKYYPEFANLTYLETSDIFNRDSKFYFFLPMHPNAFIIHFSGCSFCGYGPVKPLCVELWDLYLNVSNSHFFSLRGFHGVDNSLLLVDNKRIKWKN